MADVLSKRICRFANYDNVTKQLVFPLALESSTSLKRPSYLVNMS